MSHNTAIIKEFNSLRFDLRDVKEQQVLEQESDKPAERPQFVNNVVIIQQSVIQNLCVVPPVSNVQMYVDAFFDYVNTYL